MREFVEELVRNIESVKGLENCTQLIWNNEKSFKIIAGKCQIELEYDIDDLFGSLDQLEYSIISNLLSTLVEHYLVKEFGARVLSRNVECLYFVIPSKMLQGHFNWTKQRLYIKGSLNSETYLGNIKNFQGLIQMFSSINDYIVNIYDPNRGICINPAKLTTTFTYQEIRDVIDFYLECSTNDSILLYDNVEECEGYGIIALNVGRNDLIRLTFCNYCYEETYGGDFEFRRKAFSNDIHMLLLFMDTYIVNRILSDNLIDTYGAPDSMRICENDGKFRGNKEIFLIDRPTDVKFLSWGSLVVGLGTFKHFFVVNGNSYRSPIFISTHIEDLDLKDHMKYRVKTLKTTMWNSILKEFK